MRDRRRQETLRHIDLVRIVGHERPRDSQEQDQADQHEAHAPGAVSPNLRQHGEKSADHLPPRSSRLSAILGSSMLLITSTRRLALTYTSTSSKRPACATG